MSEPAVLVVPDETRLDALLPALRGMGGLSEADARRVLLANNGLHAGGAPERLPRGHQVVCLEPKLVEGCSARISGLNAGFRRCSGLDPRSHELARRSPAVYLQGLSFLRAAESSRLLLGANLESALRAAAYGAGGLSGYSTAMTTTLDEIAKLSRIVADEVASQMPLTRRGSVPKGKLPTLEGHLLRSQSYSRLRRLINQLPSYLQRRLGVVDLGAAPNPNARFFRSQLLAGGVYHSGVKASETVAGRLGAALRGYGRLGRATTWVIPAVLGAYEVSQAHSRERLRVATQQGTGIVLAAAATTVAGTAVTAALTSAVVTDVRRRQEGGRRHLRRSRGGLVRDR